MTKTIIRLFKDLDEQTFYQIDLNRGDSIPVPRIGENIFFENSDVGYEVLRIDHGYYYILEPDEDEEVLCDMIDVFVREFTD